MAGGEYDSSLTRVRPFFTALIDRDPSGEGWLGSLLSAAPHGRQLLDALDGDPGVLLSQLTTPGKNGLLRCFEFPVAAPRELLAWFVEQPDQLVWPKGGKQASEETVRMRRALLFDEPPGRDTAQEAARTAVATKPPTAKEWWRFEGESMLDCVLMTDRLVVTVEGKRTEPISASTAWYPKRSQLIRNLEAAKQLAKGRRWASLLISEQLIAEGADARVDAVLADSAPHLEPAGHRELSAAYAGNLTWTQACEATHVIFDSLPKTTAEL